jgi:pimeloyl-ACP methyl ester carboxylesterase
VSEFEDRYWWSQDGLRLHYRDFAGGEGRPAIICLPGLTRNIRDFEAVSARLAGDWRVICVELRGRGESAYAKDPMTYVPLTYLQDIERLLVELALDRFICLGTSLGGIITMLLAATGPARIAGALINDIGPELSEVGLDRIRHNVGTGAPQPTWVHAARTVEQNMAVIYPDYELEDWLKLAKRLYRLTSQGRVVLDYDARISEPFRVPGGAVGVDLWPAFDALAGRPITLLRGELSDLLTVETAGKMKARLPGLDVVTVPSVGHAPTLDEPESIAAIDRLLERVLAG